jgi:hypothetical protein
MTENSPKNIKFQPFQNIVGHFKRYFFELAWRLQSLSSVKLFGNEDYARLIIYDFTG